MARSTRGGRRTGNGEETGRDPALPQEGDGPASADRKTPDDTTPEATPAGGDATAEGGPPPGPEVTATPSGREVEPEDAADMSTDGKPGVSQEVPRDPWAVSTNGEEPAAVDRPAEDAALAEASGSPPLDPAAEATVERPAEAPASEPASDPVPETAQEAPKDGTLPEADARDPGVTPMAPAARPSRSGSVIAPIFGGVVAAGIGAAVVLYLYPEGWRTDPGALEARLQALEDRPTGPDAGAISEAVAAAVAPLEERLAAFEAGEGASLAGLEDQLATLTERLDGAEAIDLDAVEERLQSLAARIEAAEGDAPGPDLGPLERALETLGDRLAALEDGQGDRIAEAVRAAMDEAQADQEARALAIDEAAQALAAEQARLGARMALTELSIAAESGVPAPDALSRVAAAGDPPAALDVFAQGVPTLAELQASFPEAARRALIAAPVATDAPLGDRVTGFLRSQVGARSLAPRAGGDPDAILSRAEAAVREGRLADALQEIEALPPEAAAELAAWRSRAERRTEALAALAEMQTRLGSE